MLFFLCAVSPKSVSEGIDFAGHHFYVSYGEDAEADSKVGAQDAGIFLSVSWRQF